MDTKRLLTSVLVAGALMLLFNYFYKGNGAGAGGGAAGTAGGPGAASTYATIPIQPAASEAGAMPETIVIGNAGRDSSDKLELTVNNVLAGIDQVRLNVKDYAQTVKGKNPLILFQADPALAKPFSTFGIHLTVGDDAKELPYGIVRIKRADGTFDTHPATDNDSAQDISASNSTNLLDAKYVWKIEQRAPDVVFLATFSANGKPVAEIRKRFHADLSSYELTVSHEVKNLSGQPLHVRIDQAAAADLPRDDPQTDDRFFHAAKLDSTKKIINADGFNFTQYQLSKAAGGTQYIGQFNEFPKDPFLWIASSNRFFVTITRPLPAENPPIAFPLAIGKTIPEVHHISSANVDVMHYSTLPSEVVGIARLMGATVDLPAGGSVNEPLSVYLGPKNRQILEGQADVSKGREYDTYEYISVIQLGGGCYSFCAREAIVSPILLALNFLHRTVAFGNYGVAIMILVILVRAALHPLTRASQINMAKMGKKMRDVAPKIESMKKKYADNKKKQSEETMRIYRENNVNPAGGLLGCLPMLIQMPIWAALYSGLRSDIDLRHAAFIPGWINDLSNPDTVWPSIAPLLGHPIFTIPLINMEIYGLNLLPILLAGVFFLQMKVSAASQPKPADDQQAQMQKMSQYTIFLFPLFLYNAPSGLNLYIFASTMGGLLDTYLVRKTLKKQGILPASAEALPTHEQAAAD